MNLAPHLGLKQCRYGPMLYLKTDQYIGGALDQYGEFSEAEVHFFRQIIKDGWTVVDVGANHGTHTVALAQLVGRYGRVYSFEPQRYLYHILCANLALNDLTNVEAHCMGVGKECGLLNVPFVDYTSSNNFGAVEMGGEQGRKVPLLTLDALKLKTLHFAKIDAEGMEGDIIDGAVETIQNHRPLLYMENDRDLTSAELIKKMWGLEYVLYYHLPYYFNVNNAFMNPNNIYGRTISVNMFCVPKERAEEAAFQELHLVTTRLHLITQASNTWRDFA
jgi:FkbM family methyltransferase